MFPKNIKSHKMNSTKEERKSLNIVIKHVFVCNNPCIYTSVVQKRLMMFRGWQRLHPNIWNYSNKKDKAKSKKKSAVCQHRQIT